MRFGTPISSPSDSTCCMVDCPVVVKSCPADVIQGTPCSGHGTCLTGVGVCKCFEGYTGDACDACAAQYVTRTRSGVSSGKFDGSSSSDSSSTNVSNSSVSGHGSDGQVPWCVYLPGGLSTCRNGVRDGSEVDVDCGGVCPPCTITSNVNDEAHPYFTDLVTVGILGGLPVLAVLVVVVLYRRQRRSRRRAGEAHQPGERIAATDTTRKTSEPLVPTGDSEQMCRSRSSHLPAQVRGVHALAATGDGTTEAARGDDCVRGSASVKVEAVPLPTSNSQHGLESDPEPMTGPARRSSGSWRRRNRVAVLSGGTIDDSDDFKFEPPTIGRPTPSPDNNPCQVPETADASQEVGLGCSLKANFSFKCDGEARGAVALPSTKPVRAGIQTSGGATIVPGTRRSSGSGIAVHARPASGHAVDHDSDGIHGAGMARGAVTRSSAMFSSTELLQPSRVAPWGALPAVRVVKVLPVVHVNGSLAGTSSNKTRSVVVARQDDSEDAAVPSPCPAVPSESEIESDDGGGSVTAASAAGR